jgi:hypothetical protein
MKTSERSIDEREWILSVASSRDISMSINDADYIASHYLRQLQAERQKREEMVEAVLATSYFDDWDCHVIDYEQVITIAQKYGIIQPNNK